MSRLYVIISGLCAVILFSGLLLFPRENVNNTGLRNYMLVFDVKNYSPKVKEAITYFINDVLREGDQLIVVSPTKLVGFSAGKLSAPKKQLIKKIVNMLKEDISRGMARYRSTIQEMTQNTLSLSGQRSMPSASTLPAVLATYQQNRQILYSFRENLEARLLKFNKIFRQVKGDNRENHLLMILEKETRPIPDRKTMEQIRQSSISYGMQAVEVFYGEKFKTQLDLQKLEKAFKYADVKFHFLYLQGKGARSRKGIEFIENSGESFNSFSILAKATGGIQTSSSRPTAFLKKIEQLKKGKVEVEVIDQSMKKEDR